MGLTTRQLTRHSATQWWLGDIDNGSFQIMNGISFQDKNIILKARRKSKKWYVPYTQSEDVNVFLGMTRGQVPWRILQRNLINTDQHFVLCRDICILIRALSKTEMQWRIIQLESHYLICSKAQCRLMCIRDLSELSFRCDDTLYDLIQTFNVSPINLFLISICLFLV